MYKLLDEFVKGECSQKESGSCLVWKCKTCIISKATDKTMWESEAQNKIKYWLKNKSKWGEQTLFEC